MDAEVIARMGRVLSEPARTAMLTTLIDGRARTASELSRRASVAPSTASEHLGQLHDAGLVTVVPQGRHRYYRIAGPRVAQLLEALAVAIPDVDPFDPPRAPSALLEARSCYDHLAGRLGTRLFDTLEHEGVVVIVDEAVSLLDPSAALLEELDVDIDAMIRANRPTVRVCIDWTERRWHLSGGLGAQLLDAMLDRRWLVRTKTPRALRPTSLGSARFQALLL